MDPLGTDDVGGSEANGLSKCRGGGGVLPYISYIGMCAPSGRVFAPFWAENGYTLCPLWSGIRYGF